MLLVAGMVGLLSRCMSPGAAGDPSGTGKTGDPRGPAYVGMAACLDCHKGIGGTYVHSAHAQTSRAADIHTVLGSFKAPDNVFVYDSSRKVVMEQWDSGLFQVAVTTRGRGGSMTRGRGGVTEREGVTALGGVAEREAHRFDIAVGSGRKAQTYLYWNGDGVFQLPISYFLTEHSWANSPYYPPDSIWFGRAVAVGCFECHATSIGTKVMLHKNFFEGTPQYDRATLIYGIDCERCHGPGALHTAWQRAHPEDTVGRYMAPFARLTRQQRLDVCAVCHSGAHSGQQRSVFHFKPGDTLSQYYFADPRLTKAPENTDVHGNQYELLVASQCYLQSKTLTCESCHEVHVRERENLAVFATRCMACHAPDGVTAGVMTGVMKTGVMSTQGGGAMADGAGGHAGGERAPFCALGAKVDRAFLISNCIDCHMPARASARITLLTQQRRDPVADLVRSHYITVYPEETKKKLAALASH